MSNTINYIVSYDSDYLNPDGSVNLSATVLTNVTNLEFQRNIAPSEDNATITLAGIQKIVSAREIYIYRVNSDGTYTLKFRGMTTNPEYDVSDAGLVTTFLVNSLWYMLATRLFQIAGKSPPPLQPNTNPYLVYLNPTLGLCFGQLWADILVTAFQQSYSTGHLPAFQLANFADNGYVNPVTHQTTFLNPNIKFFTDFDNIVVNDNLNVQYQSISATIDRLVTSALFNPQQSQPFLAEYRLDIGDYPYSASWADTVAPKLPTATVMLFDPVHSALGNGNNRTGIHLGDDSCNISAKLANDPTLLGSDPIYSPMAYVEFGVYNGYDPIDTIVFSEGDNIVSIKFTSDYISMNNSFVLTGGSFQGSDVVAIPIDNQRSIAEYGLKQTNQTLNNVVDQGEIQRYVGTSINFFQHPIPNIVLKPDYIYASTHTMYPGDYILVNAPTLGGVIEDSNGNPLVGSYNPTGGLITAAFTARIKTIDITWSPDQAEDITITLTFPVQNVPIEEWNAVHNAVPNAQQQGSVGGAMQFMYTTVNPASKTLLGRGRQAEGSAIHQGGGDFITNRASPFTEKCSDSGTAPTPISDSESQAVPIFAQTVPNTMTAIDTALDSVKADDILIYQFEVEVDSSNAPSAQSTASTTVTPTSAVLTVLQPDGMAIYDGVIGLNQMANILSLISKSHISPATSTSSAPLFFDDSGTANLCGSYSVIVRNTGSVAWCSDPLFAALPAPSNFTGGVGGTLWFPSYIYCPVDANNNEIGMSLEGSTGNVPAGANHVIFSWPAVIDPITNAEVTRYNIYVYQAPVPCTFQTFPVHNYVYYDHTGTNSYSDGGPDSGPAQSQAFIQSLPLTDQPMGLNVVYDGIPVNIATSQLLAADLYWYVVAAINPNGTEVACSQFGTTFNHPLTDTNRNDQAEPKTNAVPECGTSTVGQTTGTATSSTDILLTDNSQSWTPGALVGFFLSYTSGPAIGEIQLITANTATTISTDVFSPAPDASGDTYALVSSEIVITWPAVQYATGYKIYRANSSTIPTAMSQFGLLGEVDLPSPLILKDDGTTYPIDTGTHPPDTTILKPLNSLYTVYINYSYQADPKFTKAIINAQTTNPNSAVVFDPTQQWVYQAHPYVTP